MQLGKNQKTEQVLQSTKKIYADKSEIYYVIIIYIYKKTGSMQSV
jgi:hypothetical protein